MTLLCFAHTISFYRNSRVPLFTSCQRACPVFAPKLTSLPAQSTLMANDSPSPLFRGLPSHSNHDGSRSVAVPIAADTSTCPNGVAPERICTPAIFVTNDDGLDPGNATVLDLAGQILNLGHRVVVLAPGKNNSACGQKITLGRELTLTRHHDLEEEYGGDRRNMLRVYSLDHGSPADCVIIAVEPKTGLLARLGLRPVLTLSGINIGPNLGPDIVYSGTFGAARQAAMYGIPAIASSIAAFGKRKEEEHYARACENAISGIALLAGMILMKLPNTPPDAGRLLCKIPVPTGPPLSPIASVLDAFAAGNVLVNVNVPADWSGDYEACKLDAIFYRSAVAWGGSQVCVKSPASCDTVSASTSAENPAPKLIADAESAVQRVTIAGGHMEAMAVPRSDSSAVMRGNAALSTVSTWPPLHPLAVSNSILEAGLLESEGGCKPCGLPAWIADA